MFKTHSFFYSLYLFSKKQSMTNSYQPIRDQAVMFQALMDHGTHFKMQSGSPCFLPGVGLDSLSV